MHFEQRVPKGRVKLYAFVCLSSRRNGQSDWQNHKTICKALYELERDSTAKAISLFSYADAVHEDVDLLNKLIEERAKNEASLCTLGLKRTMTVSERNLIGWEPRCAAW